MIHGRVIDELWATVKHQGLNGRKLLVIRPEGDHAREDVVAVDLVSAGRGDWVIVTEGRAARQALGDLEAPVEAAVIALVDEVGRDDGDDDEDEADEPDDGPPARKKVAAKKKAAKKKAASKKKAAKKAATKPAKARKKTSDEETPDLFSEEDPEPESLGEDDYEELVVEVDEEAALPGFDDVDAIWGDEDDEDKGS